MLNNPDTVYAKQCLDCNKNYAEKNSCSIQKQIYEHKKDFFKNKQSDII